MKKPMQKQTQEEIEFFKRVSQKMEEKNMSIYRLCTEIGYTNRTRLKIVLREGKGSLSTANIVKIKNLLGMKNQL